MNLKNMLYFCSANKIRLSLDIMMLPDFDERINKELDRMLWVLNNCKNELTD